MQANRMGQSHMAQRLLREGASGSAERVMPRDVRSAIAASLPLIQSGAELWSKRTGVRLVPSHCSWYAGDARSPAIRNETR